MFACAVPGHFLDVFAILFALPALMVSVRAWLRL